MCMVTIWGSVEGERLLRRCIALQFLFAAGALLIWADLMWAPLSRDKETAEAADEYVRGLAMAW